MLSDPEPPEDEIIDLEDFAKGGKKPPKAKKYRIRIDKTKHVVDVPGLTGAGILALAGKTPESHLLSQKKHGGAVVPVGATEYIDFMTPGVERFQTIARDPTEG